MDLLRKCAREKHNNMLLGDDSLSVSGDSDVEEKPAG